MTKLQKRFGKYNVTLELWPDAPEGESKSDCHISHVTRSGKEYGASLACAMDTGHLSNSIIGEIKIESAIVDDIEEWAIENGY